jgi:hypothetical protein
VKLPGSARQREQQRVKRDAVPEQGLRAGVAAAAA